jgi:predicted esterase
MYRCFLLGLLALVTASAAHAQPTNVRTWYAKGQVFVVWEFPAPPAAPTNTVEIYASAAAQATVANMTKVGQLFFPEYTGARLQMLNPAARLLLPAPGGGTYRLAANEGAFAYTPRAAGNLFFAVVDTGSAAVVAANSDATAFNYDPVNDPVRPHPQFSGFTPGGNPYTAMVVWADGRVDPDDRRPDVPVLASDKKNGVPHVFTLSEPIGGVPAGPLSCVFALHGGGGEYQLFRPGIADRANVSLGLTDGIVVTPDDSMYANVESVLSRSNTSWFGYVPGFDPFSVAPRSNPGDTEVVVNYTSRRVFWILDWLRSNTSPYNIDADRVAIIGHSGGGRGTSHLSRQQPERFCAAIAYTPASDLTIDEAGRVDYLKGTWTQNLATNLIGPGGVTLRSTDVFTMTSVVSPTQRDFALTRVYYGKRDQDGPASWSTTQRSIADALNDSRMGYMVFWDEREHGVEKWDNETNDAADGNPGPWPDVGQWIVPPAPINGPKTGRARAQYLVDTYRASRTYPGFFNSDSDPLLGGRQPDPGPGDPDLGEPWGTWTGYFDWDQATLVDLPSRWEATVFAAGLAATPIDNAPVAEITTDVAPRRNRFYNPPAGSTVPWFAIDLATNTVVQSGFTTVEADGVVPVTGLRVPRDPARVRLVLCAPSTCPGDADNNGIVNFGDVTSVLANFGATFLACSGAGDADDNGSVNFSDITTVLANFGVTCN